MIDLATLPAPAIVEVLDYEDILASSKAQLLAWYLLTCRPALLPPCSWNLSR
jgi:phage-related baseplate assembly protein